MHALVFNLAFAEVTETGVFSLKEVFMFPHLGRSIKMLFHPRKFPKGWCSQLSCFVFSSGKHVPFGSPISNNINRQRRACSLA